MLSYLMQCVGRPKIYLRKILRRKLKYVKTPESAVLVLKWLDEKSTDSLFSTLYDAYTFELPSEKELMRLSMLHQETFRMADQREYACLTLWALSNEALKAHLDNEKITANQNSQILEAAA